MSQKENSYVINLFGTAVQVWELNLSPTLRNKLVALLEEKQHSIQDILFDLDIIRKLDVKHWTELGRKVDVLELLLNDEARIELRKNGRLAERILVKDLLEPMQLFAKYQTINSPLQMPQNGSLVVLEHLKGQTAKFTFTTQHFQIDQLEFQLKNDVFSAKPRLSGISFLQRPLRSTREEVLLIGQEVIKN